MPVSLSSHVTPDNIEDLVYVLSTNEAAQDIKKLKFVTFVIYVHVKSDHWTFICAPLVFIKISPVQ